MVAGRRGQVLLIVALGMVAICGMLALAVDAGRLYFQRRLMQDAVDAGALAGGQDLVFSTAYPTGSPPNALYHALQLSFTTFNLTPTHPQGSSFYVNPPNNTVTDSVGGYTVTAVAPTGYDSRQVKVTVNHTGTTTFAQILGFTGVPVVATATAEAGTNAKTYAIFAYTSGGSGNTINNDQNGYAQIDDGQDGADVCNSSTNGLALSNAKFHVPNSTRAALNINGQVTVNQGSDNNALFQYWVAGAPWGTSTDAEPDFVAPDTSNVTPLNPNRTKILPGGTATVNGVTITNSTASQDYYVYLPGKYTQTVTIPNNASGDAASSVYIFLNGLYYFTSGANLNTSGGSIANTSTGLPKYAGSPPVGVTDLPAAADGTNGVEFVFDTSSAYSATNSALAGASVFLVAPGYSPTGSTHIAFYIASNNTVTGAVWSETFDASASNAPRYQIWGTVFDASTAGSMTVTGVQLGAHNTAPSNTDSSGQYAINGEFIGAVLQLNNGNVLGNTAGTSTTCPAPGAIGQGKPALLVQFNSKFAPAPGVNSYLVQ
mgnify:CR=1 FL=1